jgi:hypothetical protein
MGMEETCFCGHKHCFHDFFVETVIDAVDEIGWPIYNKSGKQISFVRKTCKKCQIWLSDELI